MRNVASHSVIVASGFGIAEYTHLAGEVAHRFPAIEWLYVPHQITSLAFAILCLVGMLHAVPLLARAGITGCNIILVIHSGFTSFWFEMFDRLERTILVGAKNSLWKILDWLERRGK